MGIGSPTTGSPTTAAAPGAKRAAGAKSRAGGGSIADKFRRLGLLRAQDFVLHLPLRYEDETRVQPIRSLRPGLPGQVEGEVIRCDVTYRPRRQLGAILRDDSGELGLRWLSF